MAIKARTAFGTWLARAAHDTLARGRLVPITFFSWVIIIWGAVAVVRLWVSP
jgi:hypothetical protein